MKELVLHVSRWVRAHTAYHGVLLLVVILGIAAQGAAPAQIQGAQGAAPAQIQGAQGAVFQVDAPRQVAVGDTIPLTFSVKQAADIAGYEATLRFDTTAAHFQGLRQRDNDLRKLGRDVSPLAAIELPNRVAVGFYSCATSDCVRPSGQRQPQGGRGTVKLGTVLLGADQPGTLELALDGLKFVDAAGQPVAVALPTRTLTIQIGAVGVGPHYPAPSGPQATPHASTAAPGPFDLTGDHRVSHADAMEVAMEWEQARMHDAPCGTLSDARRDVNHDGCVDVADAQLVAANYSAPELEAVQPTASLTFTVNTPGDDWDANVGNGICKTAAGVCTLRAAISEANAHGGPDTIAFNIPGTGVQTIQITRPLPTLSDATGGTTINGYTQPGAVPNTDPLISNAQIMVEIVNPTTTSIHGLPITSANNVVRGLAIYKMGRAIWFRGSGAYDNQIVGNFIGTDATATYMAPPASDIYFVGVHIEQGAARNKIGTPATADRNVISGNGRQGVGLWHEKSDNNVVMNNIVGLSPDGTRRLSNRKHGLDFNYGGSYNIYGGTGPGERNVVSGNEEEGIEISHEAGTSNNRVVGNFIGTDVTGTQAPAHAANGTVGVQIEDRVTNNIVTGNVIGNNGKGGVVVRNIPNTGLCCTTGNQVTNNYIGIARNGNPIPNLGPAIAVNTSATIIGPGNIIAHNRSGIRIPLADSDRNRITRNAIYSNGGPGIDLAPMDGVTSNDPGDADTGPNEQLNYPVLTSATLTAVSGTACAGCTVEVFRSESGAGAYGGGKQFLGSASAGSDGRFRVLVSGVVVGQYVTATATDAPGNTSEFGRNLVVSKS